MSDYKKHFSLMCPGPVNVSERVLRELAAYSIGHREHEFFELMTELRLNALRIAGLSDKYTAVIITGSGTAANEAVIVSAVKADDVVVSVSNGEFGRRLGEISKIYNPATETVEAEWGADFPLDILENRLRRGDVDWVTMVHHETSTGELQPVEEVGALCKKYNAKLFVDSVSGFMADKIDFEAAGVTVFTTSSGKAMGMLPGLSLVFGTVDCFEALCHYPVRSNYLSLSRHYRFARDKFQTPNTPSVPLFIALNESFRILLEEGVENRFARQANKARKLRKALSEYGFELLNPNHRLSNAVSSVIIPTNTDFDFIKNFFRDRNFIIYSGKGPLLDRIMQMSTMGCVSDETLDKFIDAIRELALTLGMHIKTESA